MFAEESSYELDHIDTRGIQILRCLWPVTNLFQLKIIGVKCHHIKMFAVIEAYVFDCTSMCSMHSWPRDHIIAYLVSDITSFKSASNMV
jgi:hypothetical protein